MAPARHRLPWRRNRFGIGRGRRSLGSESRRHVGRVVGRGAVRRRSAGSAIRARRLTWMWPSALRAGHDALVELGGASRGDKTMLDALGTVRRSSRVRRGVRNRLAQRVARIGRRGQQGRGGHRRPATRIGRARPLAERSVGTPDAGAISLVMCIDTVAGSFQNEGTSR